MNVLVHCRNGLARAWGWAWKYRLSVGVVAVAIVGAAMALSCIDPLEWRLVSPAERRNYSDLVAIGEAFKNYRFDNRDWYPPATVASQFGLPDLEAMKEYLTPKLVERLTSKSRPRVCYLGYLVADESTAFGLLDTLVRQRATSDFRQDVELDTNAGLGREEANNKIYRLRAGLERFYCVEVMGINEAAHIQSKVPIAWELPSYGRPGGFVMFMDGRVEWASYPGVFPMSVNAVEELSRLAAEPGNRFSPRRSSPVEALANKITAYAERYYMQGNPIYGPRPIQCDVEPSAEAGAAKGYRIVFGSGETRKATWSGKQKRVTEPGMEFELFPEDGVEPERAAIPWMTPRYWRAPHDVYLGNGFGYRWFAKAGMEIEDELRVKLPLKGGDDRARILEEQVNAYARTQYYRESAILRLADAGEPDKAARYLEEDLARAKTKDRRRTLILDLGAASGKHSSQLLLDLYHSTNPQDAEIATLALVTPPFRAEAKDIYAGMLERLEEWPEALNAAAEFAPKDAEPFARREFENPRTFHTFRHAYEALRALEGRPAPTELERATALIKRTDIYGYQYATASFLMLKAPEVTAARNVILQSPDRETTIVLLLDIIVPFTAAPYSDSLGRLSLSIFGGYNEIAHELFLQLPRETEIDILGRFKNRVKNSEQVAYLDRLCVLLESNTPASKLFRDDKLSDFRSRAVERATSEMRQRNWR